MDRLGLQRLTIWDSLASWVFRISWQIDWRWPRIVNTYCFDPTTNYMTHLIVSFSMCHAVSSFLFFTPALTVVRHPSRWYNFSYLACNFLSNPWCQEECNQTLEQCFLKKHLIVGQSNMDRCLWKTVSLIRIPLSILSSISCGAPTRGTN